MGNSQALVPLRGNQCHPSSEGPDYEGLGPKYPARSSGTPKATAVAHRVRSYGLANALRHQCDSRSDMEGWHNAGLIGGVLNGQFTSTGSTAW